MKTFKDDYPERILPIYISPCDLGPFSRSAESAKLLGRLYFSALNVSRLNVCSSGRVCVVQHGRKCINCVENPWVGRAGERTSRTELNDPVEFSFVFQTCDLWTLSRDRASPALLNEISEWLTLLAI